MAGKKGDRELIDTGTDKRYVRRDAKGQSKESDDVGRSLAADRRQKVKTEMGGKRTLPGSGHAGTFGLPFACGGEDGQSGRRGG